MKQNQKLKQFFNEKNQELEALLTPNKQASKKQCIKKVMTWAVASLATLPLPAFADTGSSGFSFVKSFLSWIFLVAGFILLAAGIIVLVQGIFSEGSGGSRNTGIGLVIASLGAFAVAGIFAFLPAMPTYGG